jgi:ribosomal protein S18 acetylase RimI-like enzyme
LVDRIEVDGQTQQSPPEVNGVKATQAPSPHLIVVIGTSQMAVEDPTLVKRIVKFSGKYEGDVRSRLSMGDPGSRSNRVMHIAFLNGVAVGWCSSSNCGWGGDGHWGALSVDPAVEGQGIGSVLVMAAEKRLLDSGCDYVQIEYRFTIGDPAKERLFGWYEGKLGFDGGSRRSGFRCCHKALSWETFQAQHKRALLLLGQEQQDVKMEASVGQPQKPKRNRSFSMESTTSSSSSPSQSPSPQLM